MNWKIKTIELFQKQGLRALLLALSFLPSSFTFAYDFVENGIYYKKSSDGSSVGVTYKNTNYNSYSGNVIIPTSVRGYPVRSINLYAFKDCSEITSITLPNSLDSIDWFAFENCGITNISIPNSVNVIGVGAFFSCANLKRVTLPNSIQSIEAGVFADCTSLNEISIPNSVETIDWEAFMNCTSLTNITIPPNVNIIGPEAFMGCDNLANITCFAIAPPSITSNSFGNYDAILAVPIQSIISYKNTNIWSNFYNIYPIETDSSIYFEEDGIYYYVTDKTEKTLMVVTADVDAISSNSIVNIPSEIVHDGFIYSVTLIGSNSFYECKGLTSVTIPNSVTAIGRSAFRGCSSLNSVTLPNSITSIDEYTFYGCSSLMGVTIPNSVTSIGESAFNGCSNLTSVTIPNAVTLIGNKAFQGCTSMKTLNYNAISCSDFNSTTIDQPFYNLAITTINIGNGVRKIPAFFANGLSQFSNITIPSTVTSIGSSAFANCSGLKSLYCYATNPPVMESSDCFNTYNTTTLYVISSSFYAYNTTNWWNQFDKIYAVDDDGNILVTELSLNVTNKTLYVNETLQLTATITPNIASNKSVSWTSSDSSVATVDDNGLVTAIATGTAVIKATTTDGSYLSASCDVTVRQLATSITLDETEATIYTGNTLQLTATVLPSTTSNPSVIWSSSNTSVATVSSTGLVTAKSTGEAVITAKTADGSNLSAGCNVTVKRLATSISLNKTSATLYLDQTVQLTATVSPSNATDKTVNWSSSDNSIATVTSTGLVTAIAPGEAAITATTADGSDLSATCVVTVKAYVTSLTLDQSEATILEGDTITLTPTILPGYATNQNLNWSSSNTSVVSVNNGVVVGRSGGEATVTARTADGSNLSAICKVTVVPNFDITMPNLSHIRGSSNNRFDLTIDLANRYDITGMQFDMQLPDGVTIAEDGYGEYDIVLDDARKTRNHTATANSLGNNTYRILVSSATANALKGHYGTVLHIMVEVPVYHVSGNKQVKYTNIVLSEPDETRHTLPTKYSQISYYYKEGDANADLGVDVADYVITGNYILQNSPENFWYDAANVDHNSTIDVNDLTGITNIALGRREGGILQMPAIQAPEDNQDLKLTASPLVIQTGQTKIMNLSLEGIRSFAGFQMDVQLPKGIKLADASLADGNSDLSVATAKLPDGNIRLLASSFSLKDLAVNDTAFLKLTLTADDSFIGNDFITLDGIKFSEREMALHTIDGFSIRVGNDVSSLEQVYSVIRIYTDGMNIIIDCPESGTARIVTIAGITQDQEVQPGHNVIPMDNSGIYIVTMNGTTAKLRLK